MGFMMKKISSKPKQKTKKNIMSNITIGWLADKYAAMETLELTAARARLVSEYRTQRDWAAEGCTSSAAGAYTAAHEIDAINAELRKRLNAQTPNVQTQ